MLTIMSNILKNDHLQSLLFGASTIAGLHRQIEVFYPVPDISRHWRSVGFFLRGAMIKADESIKEKQTEFEFVEE